MRWRRLSEETPSIGQICLCKHDYATGCRHGVLEWTRLIWNDRIYEWRNEWGDSYPRNYAEWWCPIEEIESLMENGRCEGSANTAEK